MSGGSDAASPRRRERLAAELDRAWSELTAPGAAYAVDHVEVRGQSLRRYSLAPADVRAMWSSTAQFAERTYLVYQDERLTYAQAHAMTASVASWLRSNGVARGDRVAVAMRNYPEWLLILWACASIGVAVVGINAWWIADEIAFALSDSGPKVVFADEERLARLVDRADVLDDRITVAVRTPATEAQTAWRDVIASPPVMPDAVIDPDDDVSILYTSGTTGVPKGAQLTHRGSINTLMNIAFATEVHAIAERRARGMAPGTGRSPVALVTTPLFHVTALGVAYAITAGGGTLVLMRKWDADEALRLIEAERVTTLSGVPTIGRELIRRFDPAIHDIGSLGAIVGGGAPMPPDLIERIDRAQAPVRPHTGYGMTEASGAVSGTAGDFLVADPGGCGRILPTFEYRVIGDDGEDLPSGSIGELCLRGSGVIKGYVNRPDATAETIRGGWLHTGDVAWVVDDGTLHVVDRRKDMILRGGENVYCAEVEAAFFRHAAVMDACAFGVPDERLGEEVGLALVIHTGMSVEPDQLRSHAIASLAMFKVPRYMWLLHKPLPRNAAGKPLRRELRGILEIRDAV